MRGVEIIATGRTIGALEELDDEITSIGGKATLVQMDLGDRPAMAKLASAIHERWGRLDVMIANAGVLGVLTPVAHLDEAIWDEVIDTNLSAVWRMIRVFDPLLRMSWAGRAVLVTSTAARGYPYWSAYAASKAGVETLGIVWAEGVSQTPLKVNILNPGGVATSMYASAFPGADLKTMPKPEVSMMRNAGASEVHMRIASPPTTHPCFYGVDTPDRDKLIAANMDTDSIAKEIGVDSLAFISMDGLYRALGYGEGRNAPKPQFCDACFSGEYPIAMEDATARAVVK